MTVCKESVIETDDDGFGCGDVVGSGSLPQRQHQQTNCNNIGITIADNSAPTTANKRHNLSLPLEQYSKQFNRDINILRSAYSPQNNNNELAINNGGTGGGGGGGGGTTNNNNHTNCARSCSDVFAKRHSFSLRLDMSPATDIGDASSRKALFTPDENMEVRKRKYDSPTCDKEPRLVLKSGVLNAQDVNVEEKGQRYFADIFTTLVDMRWRWTMFYFCIVYVLSWLGFAVIWWTILKSHGDIENFEKEGWDPCVVGVSSFSSVFLFSLESQHTIGYGYHRMTDVCPEAIALLSLQSIAGVLIEAISVGVFIVKISKPKKRSQTLIFSKNALICQKNGKMYLMFRLADIRHESKLLETHVRAQVLYKKAAPDGEVESIVQKEIEVGALEEDEDRILLYWPTTIVHEITKSSPFYEMSCDDLAKAQARSNGIGGFAEGGGIEWELIAVLEGVVESTGMTTQARTSYLPSEILWGRKFRSMIRSKGSSYVVDFDLFNATFTCDETPLCCAKTWRESQRQQRRGHRNRSSSSSSSSSSGSSSSSENSNHDNDKEATNNTATGADGVVVVDSSDGANQQDGITDTVTSS